VGGGGGGAVFGGCISPNKRIHTYNVCLRARTCADTHTYTHTRARARTRIRASHRQDKHWLQCQRYTFRAHALSPTHARIHTHTHLCRTHTHATCLNAAAALGMLETVEALQQTATRCNMLQHAATHCNSATAALGMQHTATYCNTLQHTATYCSTLQHTATAQRPHQAFSRQPSLLH